MKKWLKGVNGTYIIVTIIYFSLAIAVMNNSAIPRTLLTYIFPYPWVIKGFGWVAVFPVAILQVWVIYTYYVSVVKNKNSDLEKNYLAKFYIIVWFFAAAFIVLGANFH